MTRDDTSEDAADECEQQQHELVDDNQPLNKNDRKTTKKSKPRMKHPVYSNLRKAAKKSSVAAMKFHDKRDNVVEQQQQNDDFKMMSSNSKGTAKLNDVPDSWELLYDLNLSDERSIEPECVVALDDSFITTTKSVEQQTEESSWRSHDGDSKTETSDTSEQSVEEFDEKTTEQKMVNIVPSPRMENMPFLLQSQELKESTTDSLRQNQQQLFETSKDDECVDVPENLETLAASPVKDDSLKQQTYLTIVQQKVMEVTELAGVPNALLAINAQHQKSAFSEVCSTQWEGIDDFASTSNDIEAVNWSYELRSNEDTEQQAQQQYCGDPYMSWIQRPRRGTLRALRYKTEMCRTFEEGLPCTYGERCQFAHGFHELRMQPRHPKHKTELCHMYHSMGICRYGRRCSFVHTENPSLLSQMQHFNQEQQNQQPLCINKNRSTDFSGLAYSSDKVHNELQSSRQTQDSVYKNCTVSDAANDVIDKSSCEETVAAVPCDNQNSTINNCSNDFTGEIANENNSNAATYTVQLQSERHLTDDSQLQEMESAVVPSLHQEPITAAHTNVDNSQRHCDQKIVYFINGTLQPVPLTSAVFYVPYEACSLYNTTEGQLLQPSQLSLRNYSNNNNYAFHGHQPQWAQLQPLQQHMLRPQQAVAAFQAPNGIVYFGNVLTTANTTTPAQASIVSSVPVYAMAPFQCTAAEPQRIFQQTPSTYHATIAPQTTEGNHVYQVVPYFGAVPCVGDVYYVPNNPTTTYGNYAYTTHAR